MEVTARLSRKLTKLAWLWHRHYLCCEEKHGPKIEFLGEHAFASFPCEKEHRLVYPKERVLEAYYGFEVGVNACLSLGRW